jgi:hypothetical protein
MEKNVGGIDRIARLVFGPILLAVGAAAIAGVGISVSSALGLSVAGLTLLVGVVFTVTGLAQKCVLNQLIGLNTLEQSRSRDGEAGRGRTS